jgi:bifunctional UDP-N-acetylglucosamine pyrophosphorylase / glucosamine-1-phosphate N-acetyltransferase
MTKNPVVLVLAGGKNSRFQSRTPKALHPFLGTTMLRVVVDAVRALKPVRTVVVTGLWSPEQRRALSGLRMEVVREKEARGTGGAVLFARRLLRADPGRDVLVIQANLPLITGPTLRILLEGHRREGRPVTVLRAPGVPHACPPDELPSPACVFKCHDLLAALPEVRRRDDGSFSLNDIVGLISASEAAGLCPARGFEELFEVGTRYDLAVAASVLRLRKIRELAAAGVTVVDPSTTWIDLGVRIGEETVISPFVVIEGKTRIGRDCRISPNVRIADSRIGDRVRVFDATVIEGGVLEDDVQAGPFSRLRPETVVKAGSRVGNFVEMKKTILGPRSKALHLTYLGDSRVGEGVNIGAGTITCNYDGVNKNPTTIADGVFIGSGTELVAPVKVGRKAYVGAGSTITKDVPAGALALARARQVVKNGWVATREAKRGQKHRSAKRRRSS